MGYISGDGAVPDVSGGGDEAGVPQAGGQAEEYIII